MVVCKRQAGRFYGEKVVGSGPVRSYIHVLWSRRVDAPMGTQAMLVEAVLIEPA